MGRLKQAHSKGLPLCRYFGLTLLYFQYHNSPSLGRWGHKIFVVEAKCSGESCKVHLGVRIRGSSTTDVFISFTKLLYTYTFPVVNFHHQRTGSKQSTLMLVFHHCHSSWRRQQGDTCSTNVETQMCSHSFSKKGEKWPGACLCIPTVPSCAVVPQWLQKACVLVLLWVVIILGRPQTAALCCCSSTWWNADTEYKSHVRCNTFLPSGLACFLCFNFHYTIVLKILSAGASSFSFWRLFQSSKCLSVTEVFLTSILKFPSLNLISLFLVKHPCKKFLPTTRGRL